MTLRQEAVAVLFSIEPDKAGDVSYDIFRESDEGAWADPITRAEALMQSCRDDFPPTRLWSFTGNDRARELRLERLMESLLGKDWKDTHEAVARGENDEQDCP